MKNIIIFLSIFYFCTATILTAQDSLKHGLRFFLLDKGVLDIEKKSIESGKPSFPLQYNERIRISKKLLKDEPYSIIQKSQVPPSGDKRDYMSLGPYWWPDPQAENGEPYIRKDGEHNPEADNFTDHKFFPATNERSLNLSLAYYLSGNEDYAKKAVEFLRVWYLNPDTKMNPNLNYAQAVKGINTGRGAGVLEGRNAAYMTQALGLLDGSPSFTQDDQRGIHKWITDYRTW